MEKVDADDHFKDEKWTKDDVDAFFEDRTIERRLSGHGGALGWIPEVNWRHPYFLFYGPLFLILLFVLPFLILYFLYNMIHLPVEIAAVVTILYFVAILYLGWRTSNKLWNKYKDEIIIKKHYKK